MSVQVVTPTVAVRDAAFPEPFAPGLEFNAPARGKWNIVHTGMLIPGAHQIFVCARGCLRGVILTAAEMGAMDRMSWVALSEEDLSCGDLEQAAIDGVDAILSRLERLGRLSPIVLLFLSCVHRFAGFDFPYVLRRLAKAWPALRFVDCYMNPTMRKTELPEDPTMRRQLYAALDPVSVLEPKSVNLIGNERPTFASCEMLHMLAQGGFLLRDLTLCRTIDEYRQMAKSSLNITYLPEAVPAGEALEARLGQRHLYLPLCYDSEGIRTNLRRLADALELAVPDSTAAEGRAEAALQAACAVIGDTPLFLDYMATPRPLGLARLLLEHGFRVETVYADALLEEELVDFQWLQQHAPGLLLCATVHPEGRFRYHRKALRKSLAIGQKAAFFQNTPHFVNIMAGGGFYGFDGIARLAAAMREAMLQEKDTRTLIQQKGLGCATCI